MDKKPRSIRVSFSFASLVGRVAALTPAADDASDGGQAVERQAEEAHGRANVWALVREAQLDALMKMLDATPALLASRGAVGETLLHLCYLYNSPAHKAVAHALLERDPGLISTVYEGPTYHGENCLHMAVANSDEDEVRFLARRCPALLLGQADGTFFSRDRHDGVAAYMGGTPLSFAVVSNQPAIVRFLVEECGAELSARDEYGNTPAHMAVIYGRPEMYDLVVALWNKGYGRPLCMRGVHLPSLTNADGCSPIVLAASLGERSTRVAGWWW